MAGSTTNWKVSSFLFFSFSYIQSIVSNSHHDSPPAQASPRLSSAGKFSIHSAISARSPIISLILPTQKVRVYMLYAYLRIDVLSPVVEWMYARFMNFAYFLCHEIQGKGQHVCQVFCRRCAAGFALSAIHPTNIELLWRRWRGNGKKSFAAATWSIDAQLKKKTYNVLAAFSCHLFKLKYWCFSRRLISQSKDMETHKFQISIKLKLKHFKNLSDPLL